MVVDFLLKLLKSTYISYPGPEFKGMIIYMWISCRYIYIYMLCIPWCILNPFITVVVTPFIPPFHNNHPFHELIAGSEISSVLLVIRGRLGSLANEHPAGPSPPKILKTSTRGCWSIWEVHPVKNHFFRRYDVLLFFWGGMSKHSTKICYHKFLCSFRPETKFKLLPTTWLTPSRSTEAWNKICDDMCFPTGGSCLDIGNVNKPFEVKARVLAKNFGQHLKWSTSSGHFSLVLCCSKI